MATTTLRDVLLGAETRTAVTEIAGRLAEGRIGLLIGAGVSSSVGLPDWGELMRRLAVLRHRAGGPALLGEPAASERELVDAYGIAFADPLTRASMLRHEAGTAAADELRKALYGSATSFEPGAAAFSVEGFEPNRAILQMVALAGGTAARPMSTIHTFNFDDLLERAARRIYGADQVHIRSASDRRRRRGLAIAHLHGVVPSSSEPPRDLVFTQQEYSAVRGDPASAWEYRELLSLFDESDVLMVGIGLSDPNLMQVIDLARGPQKRHYAIRSRKTRPRRRAARLALTLEQRYWEQYVGVQFVGVDEGWAQLPALLVALRHATAAAAGQTLWGDGHSQLMRVTNRARWDDLWKSQIRRKAARQLRVVIGRIRVELGIAPAINLEAGIFVPGPDGMLDLPFRSDEETRAGMGPGYRRLNADPLDPQGVAGVAYAAGALLWADRTSDVWNHNFTPEMRTEWSTGAAQYESIACAPLFDWDAGHGEPLGVAYVTSSEKSTFDPAVLGDIKVRILEESLLGESMVEVIHSLRRSKS